jgi:hypothetical protein
VVRLACLPDTQPARFAVALFLLPHRWRPRVRGPHETQCLLPLQLNRCGRVERTTGMEHQEWPIRAADQALDLRQPLAALPVQLSVGLGLSEQARVEAVATVRRALQDAVREILGVAGKWCAQFCERRGPTPVFRAASARCCGSTVGSATPTFCLVLTPPAACYVLARGSLAKTNRPPTPLRKLERAMGFEPTTPTLAKLFLGFVAGCWALRRAAQSPRTPKILRVAALVYFARCGSWL